MQTFTGWGRGRWTLILVHFVNLLLCSSNLFEPRTDGDDSADLPEKLDITAISCSIVGGEEIVRLQCRSVRSGGKGGLT